MFTQIARGAGSLALGLALATGATAQQSSTFDIDVNLSNFSWSGTTSLGPITTNPTNFQVDGTLGMDLWTGGNPVGFGAFNNTGSAFLVPGTLNGSISFLATLNLTNLTFTLASSPFVVDANGDFGAMPQKPEPPIVTVGFACYGRYFDVSRAAWKACSRDPDNDLGRSHR